MEGDSMDGIATVEVMPYLLSFSRDALDISPKIFSKEFARAPDQHALLPNQCILVST